MRLAHYLFSAAVTCTLAAHYSQNGRLTFAEAGIVTLAAAAAFWGGWVHLRYRDEKNGRFTPTFLSAIMMFLLLLPISASFVEFAASRDLGDLLENILFALLFVTLAFTGLIWRELWQDRRMEAEA